MERFKVTETESSMESVTPYDRFGLDEEDYVGWPRKMAENLGMSDEYGHELGWKTQAEHYDGLNEKGAEAPNHSAEARPNGLPEYDYTSQLEFHKQEVADAEKRGMPQSQVDYHLGKIAVLQNIPKPPRVEPEHNPDCKKEGSCSCGK